MQSLSSRPAHVQTSALRPRSVPLRTSTIVSASTFDVHLRPYTLRKGDDLDSIASKREITMTEMLAMNPDLTPAKAIAGKTILLPSSKLSKRDKEIINGMGKAYRIYPVRSGETIDEIMSKRNITRAEMEAVNPGLNLDVLEANQLLKLPTNKFTVREREMLIGSRILPHEFFDAASNPFVVGIGALLMVCGFVMAWQKFASGGDYLADE